MDVVRKTITARVKNLRSFKNNVFKNSDIKLTFGPNVTPYCVILAGWHVEDKFIKTQLILIWSWKHFFFYWNRDFLTSDPSQDTLFGSDPGPQSLVPVPSSVPPSPWAALGPAGQTAAHSGTSNCGPGGSIKPPHLQAEWTALQRSVWTTELPSCLSVLAPPRPSAN